MIIKIMKLVSIAALLGALLWRPSAGYQFLLQGAVFAGAILVAVQCYRRDRVRWGFLFAAVAALFNPVSSPEFSREVFLALDTICITLFAASFYVLKTQPQLSLVPFTDRNPGRLSL